jgi:hypothetical protein
MNTSAEPIFADELRPYGLHPGVSKLDAFLGSGCSQPGSTETNLRSVMSSQGRGPLVIPGRCIQEMRGSSA